MFKKCLKSRGMMGSKVQVKGQEERHFLPCNGEEEAGFRTNVGLKICCGRMRLLFQQDTVPVLKELPSP